VVGWRGGTWISNLGIVVPNDWLPWEDGVVGGSVLGIWLCWSDFCQLSIASQ
jgi:hypothetical protein